MPVLCLVPRDENFVPPTKNIKQESTNTASEHQFLDEEYIKKHFNLPKRPLYLDSLRRPLITFPMTQEILNHFNIARKTKINQQILDGFLDPSEAITSPSVFVSTHLSSRYAG